MSTKHSMLVATELGTEDLLDIFVALADKLTYERNKAVNDAKSWKREFEMYRSAWIREMGGTIIAKSHDIDGCVLRAKQIYSQAQSWIAYQNGLSGRDPFWIVPEPAESAQGAQPK